MKIQIIICLVLIIAVGACSQRSDANSSPASSSSAQTQKLPSGNEIVITGINGLKFQNGETGLVFNYQTKIPIENHEELKSEVEEIWSTFRYDVEKAQATAGVIRATHIEKSGLFSKDGKGYGFVYEMDEKGNWHLDEDKK